MKIPRISPFMSKRDIAEIKDPESLAAIERWKKVAVILFSVWVVSVILFMIITLTISNTIGFQEA